jgi:hypothetical protein
METASRGTWVIVLAVALGIGNALLYLPQASAQDPATDSAGVADSEEGATASGRETASRDAEPPETDPDPLEKVRAQVSCGV